MRTVMEDINIDFLRKLRSECAITDEEYNRKILEFSKEYFIRDMKFEILGMMETGAFGGVFVARESKAWEKLSIKVVLKEKCTALESEDWPKLKHPNILRVLSNHYIPRIDAYVFITELYSYTLEDYLRDKWFLKSKTAILVVKQVLKDVLQGLTYLHQRNCSYINLRAKNIFISNDLKAVITNFDSLEPVVTSTSTKQEVPLHCGPPELYEPFRKDFTSFPLHGVSFDVWNYGILALDVFTKNYVQTKSPSGQITNWCDDRYPVMFKIFQRDCFKQYCKEAFPASKMRGKNRDVVLNLIATCLTIHPQKRPSTDMLLQHRYFKIDGFCSIGEGVWSQNADVRKIWKFISRPSTNKIIQIKKQSLEKIIASMSQSEERKFESESCSIKNTNRLRVHQVSGRNLLPGCSKDKISTDVQSLSIVQDSELKSSKIDIFPQCTEPKMLEEANIEVLQQEGDVLEETDTLEEIVHAHEDLAGTKVKESEIDREGFSEFSANAIFNWLNPMFLKLPVTSTSGPSKFSRWIAYQDVNIDKISLKKEVINEEERKLSPLAEFDCGTSDADASTLEENS